MRLYTLTDASGVVNEEHGSFEVDPDTGSIEVPDALGAILHRTHIGGEPAWENDAERHARLGDAEHARRRDPASLLAAFESLTERLGAKVADDGEAGGDGGGTDPAKAPAKKAPAKKTAASS